MPSNRRKSSREIPHHLVMLGACLSCFLTPIAPAIGANSGKIEDLSAPKRIFGVLGNSEQWRNYRRRFVSDDGRVIDTANGFISHSEGQGYGMLLALAAGDHETFRRIWGWTRNNLSRRDDALTAWRWDPDRRSVSDKNNATDGDLLIAWALLEAAFAWPNEGYRLAARNIALDVGRVSVLWRKGNAPLLLPATVGFSEHDRKDGPIINLSYWVFPALIDLPTVAPEFDWNRLAEAGLTLLRQSHFGASRLPSDWIALQRGRPEPAFGFDAVFSYNAIRIPLYLALSGDTKRDDYFPFTNLWTNVAGDGLPIANVITGRNDGWMTEPGYRALVALTECAALGKTVPASFLSSSPDQNYYPATLHMMSVLAVQGRFRECLK